PSHKSRPEKRHQYRQQDRYGKTELEVRKEHAAHQNRRLGLTLTLWDGMGQTGRGPPRDHRERSRSLSCLSKKPWWWWMGHRQWPPVPRSHVHLQQISNRHATAATATPREAPPPLCERIDM
ncbi:MAG: hypothetical protein Q9187_009054, partial [Circinaria calcarea]